MSPVCLRDGQCQPPGFCHNAQMRHPRISTILQEEPLHSFGRNAAAEWESDRRPVPGWCMNFSRKMSDLKSSPKIITVLFVSSPPCYVRQRDGCHNQFG